jgi:tRNA (cytidine32/uridine32-2'-O)-methyltransferase
VELADRVVIVLVRPQQPGNVGAAARAMANMGLSQLVLVDPPAWDPETARWMAPGCADLLARARVVATLDEALVGVGRVVATTARHRRRDQPVRDPAETARVLLDDPRPTAILFGREDHGLSDAEVLRAESVLRIPTASHASLNLGQAVLLTAWAIFDEHRKRGGTATGRVLGGTPHAASTTARLDRRDRRDLPADALTMEPAVAGIAGLLDRVGYLRGVDPEKVKVTFRGLLQRASTSIREVEALRGMLNRVDWALDHPGVDWRATRRSHGAQPSRVEDAGGAPPRRSDGVLASPEEIAITRPLGVEE